MNQTFPQAKVNMGFTKSLFALLILLNHSNAFIGISIQPSSLMVLQMASPTGPKAEGRRMASRRTRSSDDSGPKPKRERRERPKTPVAFDGKMMSSQQTSNENATPLDLEITLAGGTVRSLTEGIQFEKEVTKPAFAFISLDDLFDDKDIGLSEKFNSDSAFRRDLRNAIRQDIFDTTPFYANLSEKAASVLLLPDSSLEGSWRIPETMDRMKKTSQILSEALGDKAPTGDELFQAIGKLTGTKPSTHFIDIYGVQDRKISHSFHLDFGKSPMGSTQTVLWGFPKEDNYNGCGVFSHVIPLENECLAPEDHPRMEPVLFDGTFDDKHIVRPKYQPGRELLIYRDIDVLHSAPDVTYRTSVMRFM